MVAISSSSTSYHGLQLCVRDKKGSSYQTRLKLFYSIQHQTKNHKIKTAIISRKKFKTKIFVKMHSNKIVCFIIKIHLSNGHILLIQKFSGILKPKKILNFLR